MNDIKIHKKNGGYSVVIQDSEIPIFVRINDYECRNIKDQADVVKVLTNKLIRRKELLTSDGKVVRMELFEHLRGRQAEI